MAMWKGVASDNPAMWTVSISRKWLFSRIPIGSIATHRTHVQKGAETKAKHECLQGAVGEVAGCCWGAWSTLSFRLSPALSLYLYFVFFSPSLSLCLCCLSLSLSLPSPPKRNMQHRRKLSWSTHQKSARGCLLACLLACSLACSLDQFVRVCLVAWLHVCPSG